MIFRGSIFPKLEHISCKYLKKHLITARGISEADCGISLEGEQGGQIIRKEIMTDGIPLPKLFSKFNIGALQVTNRIVRSATYEARASEDGRPTQPYLDFYRRLAEGGSVLLSLDLLIRKGTGNSPER